MKASVSGPSEWLISWLDAVASGRSTMSQRTLANVQRRAGLRMAISEARKRGIHLLQLTDDRGVALVIASLEPFKRLC